MIKLNLVCLKTIGIILTTLIFFSIPFANAGNYDDGFDTTGVITHVMETSPGTYDYWCQGPVIATNPSGYPDHYPFACSIWFYSSLDSCTSAAAGINYGANDVNVAMRGESFTFPNDTKAGAKLSFTGVHNHAYSSNYNGAEYVLAGVWEGASAGGSQKDTRASGCVALPDIAPYCQATSTTIDYGSLTPGNYNGLTKSASTHISCDGDFSTVTVSVGVENSLINLSNGTQAQISLSSNKGTGNPVSVDVTENSSASVTIKSTLKGTNPPITSFSGSTTMIVYVE